MDEQKFNREVDRLRGEINVEKFDRIARTSKLVSFIVIPVLFVLFAYGAIRLNSLYKELEVVESKKQAEQQKFDVLKFENAALEQKKKELEKELMITYGLSIDGINNLSTSEVLEASLSANDAMKAMVRTHTPGRNVVIRYYKKTIDEKRVATELEALGYRFDEKSPSEYMRKASTNAIWFGAGVPPEDVKIIALALIRAGVPLKGIRPFRASLTNPDYKKNIVECGASADLENKPLLTPEEVKNATEFTR